jgi:hypoxanthine phosphoribosyltransferase
MELVKVHDKTFEVSISEEKLLHRVKELAAQLNKDFRHKNPIFMAVLNGSFMFMSDLMKHMEIDCELQFIKVSSYAGMESTNTVKTLIGFGHEVQGRSVIVVEDIVDTGNTMKNLIAQLHSYNPNEVKICTLLLKPDKFDGSVEVDYVGFEIPDDFVVGYGLDYDGLGRNFKQIYTVTD